LHRNAPHLVKNQTFIIPLYSYWDRLKYTIGLKLYDWIAGRLSLGASVFISRKETIAHLPNIKTKGLIGGVLYHDGQFDDSRLAINLVQSIFDHGGYALNYMRVNGLLKDQQQNISGVLARDTQTGADYPIQTKAVVNATGVFVDDILKMDNPSGRKSTCVSQGVHLVLDRKFFPSGDALMIPATSDGRVLFAVPWHNKVVVGTTDTPVDDASLEPVALEKEIKFILQTAGEYFTQAPQRADVLSVFAGLRPLAAPQHANQKTKEISRSHKIIVSPSRLFTIVGGKWTTYRKMGEDMVNRIEKTLAWPHHATTTGDMKIHGHREPVAVEDAFSFYGSDAAGVRALMNGDAGHWISERLQIHKSQVLWAVQEEMALTVEDVLARRTRALLLDARESIRISRTVAEIMAKALNKNEEWVRQQVEEYSAMAGKYVLS
jgi:glycerol-3-phosphate dehydrogenase